MPLAQGFALIESHLQTVGRPSTAFCACELRSPEPFTESGFTEFNRLYVKTLERWGVYRDGVNPVARTNVCPEHDKPQAPSLYAFSYTVPAKTGRGSFIVAGGGEAPEGKGGYRDHIVRFGDTSRDGLREKIRYVMAEMQRRLEALGFDWNDAVNTQAYTVHDIGALVGDEIVKRGAASGGLAWHFCRPPVAGLDFEMDVRGAVLEFLI